MLGDFADEIRYAVRTLRGSPTFALTAIVTLTLTLGINVGIFSTLNAIAFRRLPVQKPDELVRLSTVFRTGQEVPFSLPMFRELARRQTAIASLIGWTGAIHTVEAQGTLTTARVTGVTGNFFSELGAIPTAGCLLLPTDLDLDAFTGTGRRHRSRLLAAPVWRLCIGHRRTAPGRGSAVHDRGRGAAGI
jgi:hypothetical protein